MSRKTRKWESLGAGKPKAGAEEPGGRDLSGVGGQAWPWRYYLLWMVINSI